MAQILLRLEKPAPAKPGTPAHTEYVEFHLMSGNSIGRHWAVYKNGRPFSMKEKENFQDGDAVAKYVANMRKMYEGQGFKAVSGEWLGQSSNKSAKTKAAVSEASTKPPVASKTPGLGELPPGVKEDVRDGVEAALNPEALAE